MLCTFRDYSSTIVTKSCPNLATPEVVPARRLCPWDFPGENTTVGFAISFSRGLNLGLLHGRQTLYRTEPPGKSHRLYSVYLLLWTS